MKNHLDPISETNRIRWNALAKANVEYTRPYLEYTVEDARVSIGRHDVIKDVSGKNVLCLASGGGQDSVSMGLLGARVTVLDLSDVQLERDRIAAAYHHLDTKTIQGDMRDLSVFKDDAFDIVWQVYSINFVPSVKPVVHEVARVLRPGGIYFLQFANPFTMTVDDEAWNGSAYPLVHAYLEGEDITRIFPHWDVTDSDGQVQKIDSPHEFRHGLSTILNTLTASGFAMLGLWEWMRLEESPQPGSWAHFTQIAPPWFDTFWRLEK